MIKGLNKAKEGQVAGHLQVLLIIHACVYWTPIDDHLYIICEQRVKIHSVNISTILPILTADCSDT